MLSTIHFLNYLLPFLYILTFAAYGYDFVKDNSVFNHTKRIFLFITLAIHGFYLLSRTIEFNHPPITNKFEIFTILSFSIAFSYFLIELSSDIRGTGVFIIFISIIFQIFSTVFIEDLTDVIEILRNRLLGLHVISAMLGYSGFAISAVYGILYLMLFKEIKLSNFGLIFNRLPNLETLEKLSFISAMVGFIMLTIAMIIGIIWLPLAFPNFSYLDPKLIGSALVWIIYCAGIVAKWFAEWPGKKIVTFSIIGFCLAIASMIVTTVLSSSFHTFN